ncbi:ricin-type beta-trefoil lectin domain protein [Streptomyces catenulae]|uniref:RICIN domain-containing protein n=1 Tax=Streptomyces catenulae TaxID=66875 RepID=A0ABV2YZ53_9ACTN|nr:RICIN domain-containing protein [Streptomyces catenulae]
MPPDNSRSPSSPPKEPPGGFSKTFARDPGRARIGLLPERRVWIALGSTVALVAGAVVLGPLAQRGLQMSADDTRVAAAAVTTPSPEASKKAEPSPSPTEKTEATEKPGAKHDDAPPAERPTHDAPPPRTQDTPKPPAPGRNGGVTADRPSTGGAKQHPARAPKVTGPTGTINGMNGICLDVANGNRANGTPIQVHDCNGMPAQRWTMASDGTVRAYGKCMDVAENATSDGSLIHLWDCNGRPSQQWIFSGAPHDLVNLPANKCLDIRAANASNGTRVQIANCSGNPAQKWSVPT